MTSPSDNLPANAQPRGFMTSATIQKTLLSARWFDGFWERWIAHGLDKESAAYIQGEARSLERWTSSILNKSQELLQLAERMAESESEERRELQYRKACLYYHLLQWIFPNVCEEKKRWHGAGQRLSRQADGLTNDRIAQAVISIEGKPCYGRIRQPEGATGCVIVVTPIDSTKEELYRYETDFARQGLATVLFDGPGQGETLLGGLKATASRIEAFLREVIGLAAARFPELDLYLFGTSSGASWAVWGSRLPEIKRAVAVSPVFDSDLRMPDYFAERLGNVMEAGASSPLPRLDALDGCCPILLVHGKRDAMVRAEDMYALLHRLPAGVRFVEHEDEGHCCDRKLEEIRHAACEWWRGSVVD